MKSSKNGFMRFCFSEQKNDSNLAGLSIGELVVKCSPRWEKMTASQKSNFQETGKVQGSNRPRESDGGQDGLGRSLSSTMRRQREEQRRAEMMKLDIKEKIELAKREDRLEDSSFYLLHTNIFCFTSEKEIVPAELSLAKFSLKEGVQSIDKVYGEVYQVFIEPGQIPRGYMRDCLANSKATHKIPLDFNLFVGDYCKIVEDILEILLEDDEGIPPLYCMPKYFTQNQMVLEWLIKKSGTDLISKDDLQVYSLPQLLYEMTRESEESVDTSLSSSLASGSLVRNRVPTLALAEAQLDRDTFMLMPGMSCNWHTEVESLHCCQGQVLSWAYILFSLVCPLLSIPMLPGRHRPEEEEEEVLGWAGQSSRDSEVSTDLSSDVDTSSCRSEYVQPSNLLKELGVGKLGMLKTMLRGERFSDKTQPSLDSTKNF